MSAEQDNRKKDEIEEKVKQRSVEALQKEGRRLKFIPRKKGSKQLFTILAVLLIVGLVLLVVFEINKSRSNSGSNPAQKNLTSQSGSNDELDVNANNNSEGYHPSGPGDFGSTSLNLSYSAPEFAKTENIEVYLNQQANLQNGYSFKVVSVDRDWRPASEYTYRQIAEAGDEVVRVNLVVGNGTQSNLNISYGGLSFYLEDLDSKVKLNPERFVEDIYSPKDGQSLPAKQTRQISLHFKVKRGASKLSLTRSEQLKQSKANPRLGQERDPILSLRINLEQAPN